MAVAVCAKGAALPNCWGFVDGTVSYVETFKIQYLCVCVFYIILFDFTVKSLINPFPYPPLFVIIQAWQNIF